MYSTKKGRNRKCPGKLNGTIEIQHKFYPPGFQERVFFRREPGNIIAAKIEFRSYSDLKPMEK
jgi:hypothetical protein